MSEQYPLPSHAVSVWLANGALHIGVPPIGDSPHGHTLVLPLERCSVEHGPNGVLPEQRGWQALLALLSERAAHGVQRLGHRATPTQYDIDAMLRAVSPVRYTSRGTPEPTLDDLGLA